MIRAILVVFISFIAPMRIEAQTFTITGNMEYARSGHQATLLLDGRVLVTGGAGKSGEAIVRAEVFSPATGAWTLTGSTITPRLDHAATLLQNGRVLIVGGGSSSSSCSETATAETYDPASGDWSPTGALPMVVGSGSIAVRLQDGRVLVSGGGNRCGQTFNTAAVFNPSTNAWSATTTMATARQWHRAMLLADGRVLVAGGAPAIDAGSVSAEVFDPATAVWTPAAGPFNVETLSRLGALETGRDRATVTWLSNGKVLAAGGYDEDRTLVAPAEILDPVAGTWTRADRLSIPRAGHTATRLANGIGVLIAGGIGALGPSASTEIFHPVPEIPYESAPIPHALMGRPTAIARNSHAHLFAAFVREDGRSRIFEYDLRRSHLPIREFGAPMREFGVELDGDVHTLRIDNDDNIWAVVTDTNSIFKFSPEGRALLRLFKPPEPPDVVDDLQSNTPPPPRPYAFNRPTDVAWDTAGNIFVADGYRNSRVVKYSKTGRFIAAVGSRGSAPGEMQTPHSIAVDATGNVYVADGGNARIQVFDNGLNLRAIYDNIGNPWALCITREAPQYLYSASNLFRSDQPPRGFFRGEIYKMELDGTIVGTVGHADNALPGLRPIKMIDCHVEHEMSAFGSGFHLTLTIRP